MEAGYSRAVLAGGWKLILKLPAAATTPGAATGCTNPHGDPMAGYLRELARVTAAARAAAGPGANASAKAVFSAVTAARKGVERRDLEVRLLHPNPTPNPNPNPKPKPNPSPNPNPNPNPNPRSSCSSPSAHHSGARTRST